MIAVPLPHWIFTFMFSELINPPHMFAFVPLWVQTQSGYEQCIFPTLLPSSLLPFVLFTKQRHFSHPASPPLLAAALLSAPFPPHHRDPFPHYCSSPPSAAFPPPSTAGPALGSHGPLELRGHSQALFFFSFLWGNLGVFEVPLIADKMTKKEPSSCCH